MWVFSPLQRASQSQPGALAPGADAGGRLRSILIVLILLAFALRVYHLDASPLRGDEAFAVRYWAAPPADILSHLAWIEPHPFGTFFIFWIWKSLVGDGEFAMRMLPALLNVLGVPAMYALGRRLLPGNAAPLAAAFLWAIDPNLIWHAQDVRNYAIWAAMSAISMWLLLRAADRSRRINWLLYVLSATLTLYIFFLEAFMIAVHGLYVLIFRRRAARGWLFSIGLVALLLIPWLGQLWTLARSGYTGTSAPIHLADLLLKFWPSLFVGEWAVDNSMALVGAPVLFLVFCLFLWGMSKQRPGIARLLVLWLVIPAVLLVVAATRINVFLPRYLIVVTPAVLLVVAWALARDQGPYRSLVRPALVGITVALMLASLASYYSLAYPKAPDWYSLRDYLRATASAADAVIMTSLDPQTGNADPAFEYYYPGPAQIITLPHPGIEIEPTIRQALHERRAVWFVVSGSDTEPINRALLADGVLVSDQGAGRSFLVRQYRARQPKAIEVDSPLSLTVGGGTLSGYSLSGLRRTGSALTLFLFWHQKPTAGLKAFVHLIGPPKADGSPLWTQDDHPPAAPGRDVYSLDLSRVPPGEYQIEIGLYDPKTNQRLPIFDSAGEQLGDSYRLTDVTVGE
jgi:4-amino-4-deoxy-L-arabinose transferase-like glycosyltransferase